MKTLIHKGHYSKAWQAKTEINLGTEDDGQQVLVIETSKGNSSVATTASVHTISCEGRTHTHMLYEDFTLRLPATAPRCTEKAVTDLHREALAIIEDIKAKVAAFYAAKQASQ